jgi:hypothetical protein
MTVVAERAQRLMETKTIRRVRTEAGVRRYKQPIGSIIIADSLLVGLTDKGKDSRSRDIVDGANGKTYTVGKERRDKSTVYAARDSDGKVVHMDRSELEVYVHLAQIVQQEAGIDTRGPGRLDAGGKRVEGWSNNQVQAASDEIAAWGNSMEMFGGELQSALYNISDRLAEGYNPHRDIRVARHELEQLRPTAQRLDKEQGNDPGDSAESTLNSAIYSAITEGKLPKRYDADVEEAYAREALASAAANANKPRPVKTSDLSRGMWVRQVDNDGVPKGDWFKIYDLGEQSHIPGRSRIVRGKYRDGRKATHYRMGPRDKWETVADPSGEPAYVAPPPPEKPFVTKKPHNLSKGDRIWHDGQSMYVQDSVFKDDYTTAERRKNPVYPIEVSDDQAGKVNRRKITVPKGTSFAPPAEVAQDQYRDRATALQAERDKKRESLRRVIEPLRAEVRNRRGDLQDTSEPASIPADQRDWPMQPVESDYEGYKKFIGKDGRAYYTDVDADGWDLYDDQDNIIAESRGKGYDLEGLYAAMEEAVKTPEGSSPGAKFKPATSEYPGYGKYILDNGRAVYTDRDESGIDILDENDNVLASLPPNGDLSGALNELATSTASADAAPLRNMSLAELRKLARDEGLSTATKLNRKDELIRAIERMREKRTTPAVDPDAPQPKLTRLKEKFTGWKRFKMPDGKVIDVGQATEDDNRWYATGKDGWDDIVADGDDEDEVMQKLRIMIGVEQPTSFSPANTDVTPTPTGSRIMGMTDKEKENALRRVSDATRASVLGTGAPRQGRGTPGQASPFARRGDDPNADYKDPAAQLQDDEEERRAQGGRGSNMDELREARERAGQLNQADRQKPFAVVEPVVRDERAERLTPASTESRTIAPAGTGIADLDRNPNETLRNGRVLKDADAKLLNLGGEYAATAPNRLKQPNSINLNDRLMRLTSDDRDAYVALQDRATENYLNGMTHAAAWKESIETAERIPVPGHYVQQEGTRDGRGQYVVYRSLPGKMGREEVAFYRPKTNDRMGYQASQAAKARMTQENIKAKRAAARAVPVTGTPVTPDWSVKPPTATTGTLPDPANAEAVINARLAIDQLQTESNNWVSISRVRRRMADRGYSKIEQDAALKQLADSDDVDFMPESNQKILTQEDRDGAVWVGGVNNHLVSINQNRAAPALVPGSPAASHNPTGYVEPNNVARKAEIQSNIVGAVREHLEGVYSNRAYKPGVSNMFVMLADVRERLADKGYSRNEIDAALLELNSNPQIRIVPESNQKALTKRERDAALMMGGSLRHVIEVGTDLLGPLNVGPAPSTGNADVPERVLQAYQDLKRGSDPYVRLTALRDRLNDVPRTELDRTLLEMDRNGKIQLDADPNRRGLTAADRSSAIFHGGEDMHLVVVPTSADDIRRAEIESLDTMSLEDRAASLSKYTQYGPNYNRGAAEDLGRYQVAKRKGETETAEAWLVSAEENAGLRPRGAYMAHQARRDEAAASTMTNQYSAATLTEEQARELARTNPGYFMRLVGERYFKLNTDFRLKENAQRKRLYEEMMGYADMLEEAQDRGKRSLDSTVRSVLSSMRIGHAGMMGLSRTMMTIREVLRKEYDQ